MGFLIVGVLLLAMKIAEIGPVAAWSWLWVLAPFALAVAWWAFADSTGLTQRRAMRKMDLRKEERRQRSMEQLGLGTKRSAKSPPARSTAAEPRVDADRRDPRL